MSENQPPVRELIKAWGTAAGYKLAKSKAGGRLLNLLLTHGDKLLPFPRLAETDRLLAVHHPDPAYPVHILILPKAPYPDLLHLPAADTPLLQDLVITVQQLVRDLHLDQSSYRLIVNGGASQEVKHLHFHLVGEKHD